MGHGKESIIIQCHGPEGVRSFNLDTAVNVGTSATNEIPISGPNVLSRHFRFERSGGRIIVRDLSPDRRLRLNNARVIVGEFGPHDTVELGPYRFIRQTQMHLPGGQSGHGGDGGAEDGRGGGHPEWKNSNGPQENDGFSEHADRGGFSILESENPKWQKTLQQLPRAALSNHPLMLLGESGTGKDLLAREVQRLSLRSDGPFVSVNCAAIHESLVESELFGHRKGSFTGADAHRPGAFVSANKGTLFLDEVGDLSLPVQAKLLRALENQEVKPVGADKTFKVDVRVITATHRNLHQMMDEGTFRADLFYRLNVIQVDVPALRERPEDFASIAKVIANSLHVNLRDDALAVLKRASWPGNIRQLKNVLLRLSALFPHQEISAQHVAEILRPQQLTENIPFLATGRDYIRHMEKTMILERLIANSGNQRRTARDLGIPKSTLNDLVRRLGAVRASHSTNPDSATEFQSAEDRQA
jgi:DNA-binding NtrC family response regulator